MKKKVAIVSTGQQLLSILSAIDLDNIEIVALYDLSEESYPPVEFLNLVRKPFDSLSVTCNDYADTYWLMNYDESRIDGSIFSKLVAHGVDSEYIIRLPWFGSHSQFNYMYFIQWQILMREQPRIDFLVTGNSYARYGIDLNVFLPFRGVSFSRFSQDIYYSYKMTEKYLTNVKNGAYPKFCLICLAPYAFHNWVDKTTARYCEYFYFSILGHEQMEYEGTPHGSFIRQIFHDKYKAWFDNHLRAFIGKPVDLNDIDWARAWHQEHYFYQPTHTLNAADELAIYGRKKYEETRKRNIEILWQYVKLCRKFNVLPVGVLLPFSQVGHKYYPKEALAEFLSIIDRYRDEMPFVNLWDIQLANEHFEDVTHLKMTGAIAVSKVIKDKIAAM